MPTTSDGSGVAPADPLSWRGDSGAGVPADPVPADAARGRGIVERGIDFSKLPEPPAADPHAFEWLRDLCGVRTSEAPEAARRLVAGWIHDHDRAKDRSWHPATAAARLINWLYCQPLLAAGADAAFGKTLEASLARHAKRLRRGLRRMPQAAERFPVLRALILAGACLPGQDLLVARTLPLLLREIDDQILPDGGHFQRNPSVHAAVLSDLVQVRMILDIGREPTPAWIQHAIDRMAPILRFFRHGDGGLALFNGAAEEDGEVLDRLLDAGRAEGKPPAAAPYSGYQRLARGAVTVLLDAGAPPPRGLDLDAHAGALSFEMSDGAQRIIVNCGAYRGADADWDAAARATAAHSTLVIEDVNSSEVVAHEGIGRRSAEVEAARDDTPRGVRVDASHDGYIARFGPIHRRVLELDPDGHTLRGTDRLEREAAELGFAIRFHLHPSIEPSIDPDSPLERPAVRLILPDGRAWAFRARAGSVSIEDSVYLGRPGRIVPTRQIVVAGKTGDLSPVTLAWSIESE